MQHRQWLWERGGRRWGGRAISFACLRNTGVWMGVSIERAASAERPTSPPTWERDFLIDNLLVRIHLIIVMILVDRPCAMGV